MDNPIPDPLGWLLRRQISLSSTPAQEDLRRLGVGLMLAGLLAGILESVPGGIVATLAGLMLWYLGLTERAQ